MKEIELKKTFVSLLLLGLALIFNPAAKAQALPAGTQHTVTLTCTEPSPVGGSGTLLGNNFYRSLNVTPVNYAKLNATATNGTCAFTDTSVTAGTSYLYTATTVDSAGNESAASNVITVNVPTNPNPPNNLAGVAHSGEGKKPATTAAKPIASKQSTSQIHLSAHVE